MDEDLIITIKAARVNSQKSQQEAALAIGISLNAYKLKENGIRRFYVDEIVKLSRYFNISMEKIFECQCHNKTQKLCGV